MNTVGAFNDATRDAIKGSVFRTKMVLGYKVVKPADQVENIKYGITGGIDHNPSFKK